MDRYTVRQTRPKHIWCVKMFWLMNTSVDVISLNHRVSHNQVVAVAARDQSKAQDFANNFHIAKAYGSYKELSKDPEVGMLFFLK